MAKAISVETLEVREVLMENLGNLETKMEDLENKVKAETVGEDSEDQVTYCPEISWNSIEIRASIGISTLMKIIIVLKHHISCYAPDFSTLSNQSRARLVLWAPNYAHNFRFVTGCSHTVIVNLPISVRVFTLAFGVIMQSLVGVPVKQSCETRTNGFYWWLLLIKLTIYIYKYIVCGYRKLSTLSIAIPRLASGRAWYYDAACG